jgi:hypothetical protein
MKDTWTAEMVMALCALVTAIGGAGMGIFWFGRLAQRVAQVEKDQDRMERDVIDVRNAGTAMIDKIDAKLDKIWEWLHENVTRRSNDSKPGRGD